MENIYIHDKEEFSRKINKIKEEGLNRLHVVSDFDRTLTKCFVNGKKLQSTFALIRDGGYLTEDYPKKAFALFDKYNPIELDESLSFEYRAKKMQEWWQTHEKLLVESGMNKGVIEDIMGKYPNIFREGALDFLDFLHKHEIPLLIFSSGMGNIIEEYLKKAKKLYNNTHILSNTFDFDENGFATGYKDKIIHVFNKSEKEIKNKEYLSSITKRKNVILLGDSLSDIGMTSGIEHDLILKIGFLNEDVDKKLDLYKNDFDVVIVNDNSMEYVNQLLSDLIS